MDAIESMEGDREVDVDDDSDGLDGPLISNKQCHNKRILFRWILIQTLSFLDPDSWNSDLNFMLEIG